ncbi:MAG: hypothetical protein KJ914_09105 [Gammaproteobacteria bacterium]|nr:hypothetical protein [Gammaproteobacteria bacterium]MBU1723637.1 hypothetical protein [Gammaproteobacteria bacterium]MBU2005633.1 hypothetical protein [Gammaproteobacteria bacterium]
MTRRYPDADDLWQAIAQEQDTSTRRELLAQMARILLELEDGTWPQDTRLATDSTSSLLDYQTIGRLAATRIQQALPWLDPDYKGEPLEQELQQTRQELHTLAEQVNTLRQQQAELQDQQTQLEPQRQALQQQQQALRSQQQTLEQTRQDTLNLQQTITSLEDSLTRLQAMLTHQDDTAQQLHITRLLEEFNPVLQQALEHYRQLASIWRLHLDENDEVATALAQQVEETNRGDVQDLPRIAEGIANRLREYDSILSGLITRK